MEAYRGGAGGKIWYSPDGSHYTRIFADVGNNLVNPMFVGPRVVFLSDHEGTGALYSALPDGTDLRRHTDLGQYYARHATTDGQRVAYQQAGEIWLLESLDADPSPESPARRARDRRDTARRIDLKRRPLEPADGAPGRRACCTAQAPTRWEAA